MRSPMQWKYAAEAAHRGKMALPCSMDCAICMAYIACKELLLIAFTNKLSEYSEIIMQNH